MYNVPSSKRMLIIIFTAIKKSTNMVGSGNIINAITETTNAIKRTFGALLTADSALFAKKSELRVIASLHN